MVLALQAGPRLVVYASSYHLLDNGSTTTACRALVSCGSLPPCRWAGPADGHVADLASLGQSGGLGHLHLCQVFRPHIARGIATNSPATAEIRKPVSMGSRGGGHESGGYSDPCHYICGPARARLMVQARGVMRVSAAHEAVMGPRCRHSHDACWLSGAGGRAWGLSVTESCPAGDSPIWQEGQEEGPPYAHARQSVLPWPATMPCNATCSCREGFISLLVQYTRATLHVS